MFCSKCGSPIEEGARFCTACGAPVEDVQPAPAQPAAVQQPAQPEPVQQPVQQPVQPEMAQQTAPVQQPVQPETVQPAAQSATPTQKAPSNINFKKIGIIAGSAVGGIVLLLLLFCLIIPKLTYKKENAILFKSDDKLYYLKDVNKPQNAMEIDRLSFDDYVPNNAFTEDGKYIYFFTDYDNENDTSTLCRVKVSKLKKNRSNKQYIEEVAKDVRYFQFVKDDVFYLDDNGKLVMEKKGKSITVAKQVADFCVSEDDNTVYYYTSNGSYENADAEIGYIDSSAGKKVVIEDDIDNVYTLTASGMFIFKKNIEEDEETGRTVFDLYIANKKQAKKLAENVSEIIDYNAKTGVVYYDYYSRDLTHYTDYFSFPDGLSELKEPTKADAFVEVSEADVLDEVFDDSIDAEEKEEFYDDLDYDDDLGYYYTDSWWYDYEFYYDDASGKWYEVDDDKLSELWDNYNDNESLAYTAESYQEMEYTVDKYKVCLAGFDNDETVLCDSVKNVTGDADSGIIFYNIIPEEWDKVNYASLGDASAYDKIDEIYSDSQLYYQIADGEPQEFEADADTVFVEAVDGDKVAISTYKDEEKEFYYAEISGDKFSRFELLEDDYESIGGTFKSGNLYYIRFDGEDEGTLYKYNGASSEEVLSDVDGTVAVTKQEEYVYSSKGDLELYNKNGQKKDEIRDVDDYIYIKRDKILYKSDDELYLYKNAKKQRMISSDVDDFVSYARQYGLTDIEDYLY